MIFLVDVAFLSFNHDWMLYLPFVMSDSDFFMYFVVVVHIWDPRRLLESIFFGYTLESCADRMQQGTIFKQYPSFLNIGD